MNIDDVIKTYEFLGHSPVEVSIITPTSATQKSKIKDCRLVRSKDEFIRTCSVWDGQANIYVGLNELKASYLSVRGHRSAKSDIQAVHFIPVDLDSVRPDMKEAATVDELKNTIEVGDFLWQKWLPACGFLPCGYAMSGNGTQLWLKIPRYDLTNELRVGSELEWELRLKRFYDEIRASIPKQFIGKVAIDTIQDVTRIFKVIGTTSVKGVNSTDRPHRESWWVYLPVKQEDRALLDYVLSLPVVTPATVSIPSGGVGKPQGSTAASVVTLPKLTEEQKEILEIAMKAPYVVMARDKLNPTDSSESDWAFLKELSKEGIYNPTMLMYALMVSKNTKFNRDGKGSYLMRTVENFVNQMPGISLTDARKQLEKEFQKLSVNSSGRNIVVCGAGIGLGKTRCAKKKVVEAVEKNINALVVVPSHTLATEWEALELPDKLREVYEKHNVSPVVHLYGTTHENVACPFRGIAMRLLGLGHSKLFKQKYCFGGCEKREECLHIQSVKQAKDAPILIAQHEHSHIHQNFFGLRTLSNENRIIIIIDELAQFVHAVRLNRKDLFGNMKLFQSIGNEKAGKHTDVYFWDFLADRLEGMLKALNNRQGYVIPEQFFAIPPSDANKLDAEIAQYYVNMERNPKVKNLLWDLCYILERKPPIQYDADTDTLLYRWRPDLGKRTVLILSGTTRREYVEKQLGFQIDGSIGENWKIRRENLKVVQLLVGMGGRNRLLRQCDSAVIDKQHGKLFDLILYKHKGKRIALITSLGKDAPDTTEKGRSAKDKILNSLAPVAKRHGKKLVGVTNDMLQKDEIPDGLKEIPVFHFGMKGIDKLNGRFEVIWEVNAHYYHRLAISQAMFEKFDVKPNLNDVKPVPDKFFSTDMTFQTHRYIYDDLTEMELLHTQIADMIQTIGRFLRENDIYKIIYRTHNVNIEPFPTRVYKSWEALFNYEFGPYVPAQAWLSGKAANVWAWIQDNIGDKEFTADVVAQGLNMNVDNVRRCLNRLAKLSLLNIVSLGDKGRGNATTYKMTQMQA
jgi:hypothetical protein